MSTLSNIHQYFLQLTIVIILVFHINIRYIKYYEVPI